MGRGVTRSRRPSVALVCAAAVVLAVVWLQQHRAAQRERHVLEHEIEACERAIEVGLAAKRDLPRLEEAIAALEDELRDGRRVVPGELGLERYLWLLRQEAAGQGVMVVAVQRAERDLDFYREARLRIGLRGDRDDVSGTLDALERGERLTVVDGLDEGDDSTWISLRVFAMEDRVEPEALPAFEELRSGVWLPPYSRILRDLAATRSVRCAEARELEPYWARAAHLTALRKASMVRGQVVEHLRARPD